MSIAARFEVMGTGNRQETQVPEAGLRAGIDPEMVSEFVPIVAGAVIFAAAILAKSAYVMAGLGPKHDIPATLGIASLGAIIGYGVFRHTHQQVQAKLRGPSLGLLPITGAVTGVFLLMLSLLALLGIVSRYGIAFLSIWFTASIALMAASLAVLGLYRRLLVAEGRLVQRVAVYGGGELARQVIRALGESAGSRVVAAIYDDPPSSSQAGTNSAQAGAAGPGINELIEGALDGAFDRVVLALPITEHERIKQVLRHLEAVPVAVQISSDVPVLPCKVQGATSLGALTLLEVQRHPLGPQGIILKTVMDLSIAAIALVALAPVMALIALAIKLDSRGPVFFVQPRGGYRHKVVNVIKFRSMTVLENGPHIVQATRNDPRVTRVGRFLRRTSLDELPQLINVLRGELSLVGPRPHALAHDKHYGAIVEQYANRHKIKPGITGWAQINGCRSETRDPEEMRERIKHDLYYIENWSPWLDLKILFYTIGVVLWDRHAY